MHGLINDALSLVAARTTKTQFSYYVSPTMPLYAAGLSGLYEKTGTDNALTPYSYNPGDEAAFNGILDPFISPVVNLTSSFVPISLSQGSGVNSDIVIFRVNKLLFSLDGKGALARAYDPTEGSELKYDIVFASGGVGSSGVAHRTLAHELLHSLGLNDAKNTSLGSRDTGQFTLMSYNNHPGEVRIVNQPQLYDVAALQSIFGRNTETNLGATNYNNFTSTDQDSLGQDAIYTIWDSGGNDTISASALSRSAFIDLRPGYFSSIGPANNVVVTGGASPALANPGWLNISIAFGAYIENATGSQASDYIVGNILTNSLSGGNGADVLYAEEAVANYDPGTTDYRRVTNSGSYTTGPLAAVQAFISDPTSQRDMLLGDAGDDYLAGGRGSDILHGGAQSATTSAQAVLEADGKDTADYRPLAALDAAKGIAIRVTDQVIDPTLATNVDAKFGTWVTDQGRGGGNDLLISVETVTATAADDVLVVTKLDPLRLAGSDGTGGLATVDLGGQSAGDLIDLSPAIKGMTVSLVAATGQVFATDTPSLSLGVIGAEKVLGSAFDDKLTGGAANDVLAGGGGTDTLMGNFGVDYLYSGTSTGAPTADLLSGGNGDDWLIAEAGSSADLRGLAQNDTYVVTRSDIARAVMIYAPEAGDKLVWNGYQLAGGSLSHIDGEGSVHVFNAIYGYLGARGEVYRPMALDPVSTGDLIITFADASKVVVHDWSQGELGITLAGGAMPSFGVVNNDYYGQYAGGFSNQFETGAFLTDDWDTIDNAADALATPGPITVPPPPAAFVPPGPDLAPAAGVLGWAAHHPEAMAAAPFQIA